MVINEPVEFFTLRERYYFFQSVRCGAEASIGRHPPFSFRNWLAVNSFLQRPILFYLIQVEFNIFNDII